jgi:arsenite oxidase large subunit
MLFGHPLGPQGNVVSAGVNELMIPNYKQTWANIRRMAAGGARAVGVSFKSRQAPALG